MKINTMRYTIENQGKNYLCTDHDSGLYVIFEARKFNETQGVNIPEGMTPDDALRALVEMSDWLAIFHYSLVMPERATARQMIAHQLSSLRRREGLTQQQLADRVGCPQSTIARLERARHDASVGFVAEVAEALGCELRICERE